MSGHLTLASVECLTHLAKGAKRVGSASRSAPGSLIQPDEAVPAPADGCEPGARANDGRRRGCRSDGLAPTVEEHGRRAGIQTDLSRAVFTDIHQDIHERVTHRPRSGELPGVIATLPDGAPPVEGAVDRPRRADRETAETPAERRRVVGLDDKMHVIVLRAELENPEAAVGGRGQGTVERRKDPLGPQATDSRPRAEGDVDGCAPVCGGRERCGTPGRRPGVGFRPAPARRPPQAGGVGSESCKPRAILIGVY